MTNTYTSRIVDAEIDLLFAELPALSIEGPKGVGKTVTAQRRAATIFRLDELAQREILAADLDRLTKGRLPILIDEWQRMPESWDLVRRAVDGDRTPGQFLLTGLASPLNPQTHSGAGRIVMLRMRPLSIAERGLESPTVSLADLLLGRHPKVEGYTSVGLAEYTGEILSSGFPGIRHLSQRSARAQLDSYIDLIVDRDIPEAGRLIRNKGALLRWMAAYAAGTATTTSYERIREAATSNQGYVPARSTTEPYRVALERLWIVDPLPAWTPSRNYFSRLALPPKHHLADPALAARLLGLGFDDLLSGRGSGLEVAGGGSFLGALFESLVTQSVRVYAQNAEARVYHLRTRAGEHEVDLVVVGHDSRTIAIEIKLSQSVSDNDCKHLRWMQDKMGNDLSDAIVITTGHEAYRRKDGIAVVPATLLGP